MIGLPRTMDILVRRYTAHDLSLTGLFMKFVARGHKSRPMQGKGPVGRAAYCRYVSYDGPALDEADGQLTRRADRS